MRWAILAIVCGVISFGCQLTSLIVSCEAQTRSSATTEYQSKIVDEGDVTVIDGKIYRFSAEEIK